MNIHDDAGRRGAANLRLATSDVTVEAPAFDEEAEALLQAASYGYQNPEANDRAEEAARRARRAEPGPASVTTIGAGTVLAENVGGYYRVECTHCDWAGGVDTRPAARFFARRHVDEHLDLAPAELVSVLVLRAVELVEAAMEEE